MPTVTGKVIVRYFIPRNPRGYATHKPLGTWLLPTLSGAKVSLSWLQHPAIGPSYKPDESHHNLTKYFL